MFDIEIEKISCLIIIMILFLIIILNNNKILSLIEIHKQQIISIEQTLDILTSKNKLLEESFNILNDKNKEKIEILKKTLNVLNNKNDNHVNDLTNKNRELYNLISKSFNYIIKKNKEIFNYLDKQNKQKIEILQKTLNELDNNLTIKNNLLEELLNSKINNINNSINDLTIKNNLLGELLNNKINLVDISINNLTIKNNLLEELLLDKSDNYLIKLPLINNERLLFNKDITRITFDLNNFINIQGNERWSPQICVNNNVIMYIIGERIHQNISSILNNFINIEEIIINFPSNHNQMYYSCHDAGYNTHNEIIKLINITLQRYHNIEISIDITMKSINIVNDITNIIQICKSLYLINNPKINFRSNSIINDNLKKLLDINLLDRSVFINTDPPVRAPCINYLNSGI